MKPTPSKEGTAFQNRVVAAIQPDPTSSGVRFAAHGFALELAWWSNSASCVVWEGIGKDRKIAVCPNPETAKEIVMMRSAFLKAQNAKSSGGTGDALPKHD